jgi:hypothetical protein
MGLNYFSLVEDSVKYRRLKFGSCGEGGGVNILGLISLPLNTCFPYVNVTCKTGSIFLRKPSFRMIIRIIVYFSSVRLVVVFDYVYCGFSIFVDTNAIYVRYFGSVYRKNVGRVAQSV